MLRQRDRWKFALAERSRSGRDAAVIARIACKLLRRRAFRPIRTTRFDRCQTDAVNPPRSPRPVRQQRRAIVIGIIVATLASACGGSSDEAGDAPSPTTRAAGVPEILIADGVITDAAVAAATRSGEVQPALLAAIIAEVLALEPNEQLEVLADISQRFERSLAIDTGIVGASADPAEAESAIDAAWEPIREAVDEIGPALSAGELERAFGKVARTGGARPADGDAPTAQGLGGVGVFLGMMGLAVVADSVVAQSNGAKPDQRETRDLSDHSTISGSLEEAALSLNFDGSQDGVAVKFTASLVVHPCPDASGRFDAKAEIDIRTSKDQAGSNIKIAMNLDGQVDDDAHVANVDAKTRTEWANFANAKGEYVDFTATRTAGKSSYAVNREGGTLTEGTVNIAVIMSGIFAAMVEKFVVEASEKGWSSGRCVDLKVTPSDGPQGLEKGAVVDVLAEPRSKLDGQPVGGAVTATLKVGGQSVEPDGSPVPADASSTYTAPDEDDKTGVVDYESRSRRGVGRASITFSTSKPSAYRIVGGLDDWKVDQVVCNIMEPFTLTGEIGSMQLSGGLSGTYVFDGMFSSHYEGTYEISIPDGSGKPGTMVGTGSGSIAGQAGSGTENYTLTPTTC